MEEPLSGLISDTCDELDGEDPQLSIWDAVRTASEIYKYENDSRVQKFEDYNYIYCFPGRIEINNRTHRCPLEVFRLPANIAFETAKQRHVPTRIDQNITFREHFIVYIAIGHFEDDSDVVNELRMCDKISEMKSELGKIKEVNFVIDRSTGIWWGILSCVLSSVVGALAYLCIVPCVALKIRSCFSTANTPRRPQAETPYELMPMAATYQPIAQETPGKIYVSLT